MLIHGHEREDERGDGGRGPGGAGSAVLDAAAEVFKALSNRHRLAMLCELGNGPCCVHELVDALGLKQSLVSQHLRVLRTTGLVATSRRGQEVVYSIQDEHVSNMVTDALRHATEN